jgi:site-specific recombinase XerD
MTPDSRNLFRNHERSCPHRKKGRAYKKCHCPIWIDFSFDGKRLFKSLGTRNWQLAENLLREWETNELHANEKARPPHIREPDEESEPKGHTVADACAKFLADARARELREPTLYKYTLILRRLLAFTAERGIRFVPEITVELLREFRAAWPHRNTAARRRIDELRTFFGFCLDSGWIASNPAKSLKAPPCTEAPVEPFRDNEVKQIRAAYAAYSKNAGKANAQRLEALVEVMLCTGSRIKDTVTLRRDCVEGGKLRLRTEKTGTVVCCPLPPSLIEKLQLVRCVSSQYFFWSGNSKPKSAVGDYQRALKRLFKLAGVSGGHAHRFRHTFAKCLLMEGVPLERVAVLMGHRSPSITLKYYASWVKERQEQLEADVTRVWDGNDDQKQDTKPLKRPESAIQTLYGDSSKWLN